MKTIILLTGVASQQFALTELLKAHNPALSFRCAVTAEDLAAIEPEVLRHKVRRRPNPPFLASRRCTEPRAAESAREAGPGWPGIAARRPAAGQRGRLDCTDTACASRCRCTSRS